MENSPLPSHNFQDREGSWNPKVVAFCCNWCAYAGADLAGMTRRQCSTNVRIVRVMCSGRVSPGMILRALISGADGVMVLGCHPGDCHYRGGNFHAQNRVTMVKELLALAGIEPSRVLLRWVSASEGDLFVQTVNDFVANLHRLGPLGGSDGSAV
ncbi:MAG: hydrogenase iron-sulfur subunit [Methanomassiliicoccales archaeon]